TSDGEDPKKIDRMLNKAGMNSYDIIVGERLGYEDEKITCYKPGEICDAVIDPLNVMYLDLWFRSSDGI
ncbi:MAG: hypothetical protein K6F86_02515, partial [Lachnospiraceae bacterium]|nr:hypothetical protein [Lachnospiraceae bacterium]